MSQQICEEDQSVEEENHQCQDCDEENSHGKVSKIDSSYPTFEEEDEDNCENSIEMMFQSVVDEGKKNEATKSLQ